MHTSPNPLATKDHHSAEDISQAIMQEVISGWPPNEGTSADWLRNTIRIDAFYRFVRILYPGSAGSNDQTMNDLLSNLWLLSDISNQHTGGAQVPDKDEMQRAPAWTIETEAPSVQWLRETALL